MGTGNCGSEDLKPPIFRKPQRITITVSHAVYEALALRSTLEGRSLSNLASTLLEMSLNCNGETGKAPGSQAFLNG